MTKKKLEYPEDMRDVMVTYKKKFYSGAYGSTVTENVVTKRGFYSKMFDNISVPPAWRKFNGVLLPDGFGGDRLKLKDVIKWEYCE